jgi:hypothetical protein
MMAPMTGPRSRHGRIKLVPAIALMATGCLLFGPKAEFNWADQDRSIKFPSLYPPEAARIDGVVLRALRVAADDFISPDLGTLPCLATQEAHEFHFLRQGDVVFIRISGNPAYCDAGPYLDGSGWYAISVTGKILHMSYGDPRFDDFETDGGRSTPLPVDDAGRPILPDIPRDDAGNPILSSGFLRSVELLRLIDQPAAGDAGSD